MYIYILGVPGHQKILNQSLSIQLGIQLRNSKIFVFYRLHQTERSDQVRTMAHYQKFTVVQTAAYVGVMCTFIFWECQDITESRQKIGVQLFVAPSMFGAFLV